MLVLSGAGEAGIRAGARQRVLSGWVSQAASLPEERSRTGRSPGAGKLGVNLSRETSKRAGKYSGARLVGRHQREPAVVLPAQALLWLQIQLRGA